MDATALDALMRLPGTAFVIDVALIILGALVIKRLQLWDW